MILNSEQETATLAKNFAKNLKGHETIALQGDLGTGKTFFTRALAEGLNIAPRSIKSPTFTILREYNLSNSQKFVHIDLYRLLELDQTTEETIIQHIEDPQTITAIEWPERAPQIFPPETINVHLKHISPTSREIQISNA